MSQIKGVFGIGDTAYLYRSQLNLTGSARLEQSKGLTGQKLSLIDSLILPTDRMTDYDSGEIFIAYDRRS